VIRGGCLQAGVMGVAAIARRDAERGAREVAEGHLADCPRSVVGVRGAPRQVSDGRGDALMGPPAACFSASEG
jgi:hypothetical protein